MSWVAAKNTRVKKITVNRLTFGSSTSSKTATLFAIHHIIIPTIVWIGTIQLLRRPSLGEKIESTMGDHSNLRE